MKFKSSAFRIYDDKLLIERNKMIIEYNKIKEIFQERNFDAIIILNNGDGVPIEGEYYKLKAFINVLNRLIEKNKSDNYSVVSNENISGNSEDNFDKLIKLGEMYEKELLTDEEFTAMKKKLIEGN